MRGVFEELPKLKFVASHLGGGICEIIGRMDYAYELRDNPLILGPYGPPIYITRKPSDYLRMIYFDTVSYHAPAVECAIKTVGADRLIFGHRFADDDRAQETRARPDRSGRAQPRRQGQGARRHRQDAAETLGGTIMKAAVVGEKGAEVRDLPKPEPAAQRGR